MPAAAGTRRKTSGFPRASIEAGNRVVYRPASGGMGQAVTLDGEWRLSRSHQLAFNVRQKVDRGQALPEHAFLKATVTGAGADSLNLAWEGGRAGAVQLRRLQLSGRWQADASNRLNFLVERGGGAEDRLVFGGGWEVGPYHELQYRFRRPGAGRPEQTLVFDGAWDIAGRNRLVYRVSGSSRSVFEFRASLQHPAVSARDQALVYQVGIGAGASRTKRRVTLFGRWKLKRDLSVAFEIPYARGRVEAIRFEGEWAFGPRDQVRVALSGQSGRPLGIAVTFSRDVAPDRQLFLQLRKQAEERSVIAGMTVRF